MKLNLLLSDVVEHSQSNLLAIQIMSVLVDEFQQDNAFVKRSVIVEKLHRDQSIKSFLSNVSREVNKMVSQNIVIVEYLDEEGSPVHSNVKNSAHYKLTQFAINKYSLEKNNL